MCASVIDLRGIVPSLNTPFTEDGRVDRASLAPLVAHLAGCGCAGALALAAAGETAYLTSTEWETIAGDLADAARGQLPLILSLTAADLDGSLTRARVAARLGVSAVLWQPPPGTGLEAVADGISRLADASGLPLMLQDLDFVGTGMPLDWIVDLFVRGNGFASLKVEIEDAGPKYSAVLDATGGALHVAGGWAVRTMTDALARGVHAFIPTEMEPLYVAVDRMWRAGERDRAQALFDALLPVLSFANRDLDHSIRFLKRMRWRNGSFATDQVRVQPSEMDVADQAEADRLIALAARLTEALPALPLRD